MDHDGARAAIERKELGLLRELLLEGRGTEALREKALDKLLRRAFDRGCSVTKIYPDNMILDED